MSEKWLSGKVIENRHWTESLFSLRVEAPRISFQAGQFVRIALDINGERIARAFSFVNPAEDPVLEFYGIVVPEGPLSPRLAKLTPGEALYIAHNPAGFLRRPRVGAQRQDRATIGCDQQRRPRWLQLGPQRIQNFR